MKRIHLCVYVFTYGIFITITRKKAEIFLRQNTIKKKIQQNFIVVKASISFLIKQKSMIFPP